MTTLGARMQVIYDSTKDPTGEFFYQVANQAGLGFLAKLTLDGETRALIVEKIYIFLYGLTPNGIKFTATIMPQMLACGDIPTPGTWLRIRPPFNARFY